jgi:hypothetical protein
LPVPAKVNLLPAVTPRSTSPHYSALTPRSMIGGTAERDDVTAVPVSAESGRNAEGSRSWRLTVLPGPPAGAPRPFVSLGPLDRGEQAVSHRQQQRHQALIDPDLLAEFPDRDRGGVAGGQVPGLPRR